MARTPVKRRPDGQVDRCQFILGLHHHTAHGGQVADQKIHHIGRRRDRVSGKKASARRHESHRRRVVARYENPFISVPRDGNVRMELLAADTGVVGIGLSFAKRPDVRFQLLAWTAS